MRKMLFSGKKRAFLIALAVAAAVVMAGCSDPVSPPNDPPGPVDDGSVNKFVAVPSPYTENDQIAYSFSYGGYDFYYIHLGTLVNVPMFFLDPEHFGTTAEYTYTFTTAHTEAATRKETIRKSSERAVSEIDQKTFSSANSTKLSNEISAGFSLFGVGAEVKREAEGQWSEYTGKASSTEFTETTSLTNTVTHVTSFTEGQIITHSWRLSRANGDREGWYRYTLFYATDVYLYVIKDAGGGLAHYEFLEHVKPDVYGWKLDYSETGDFKQSDASVFEFDISMLDNLPKPVLSFDALIPPGNISAQAESSSRITVSWSSITSADSYRIYRSTREDEKEYPLVGTSPSHLTSYTDTGLSPVTTYYYKVAAAGANAEVGEFSTAVRATTMSRMSPDNHDYITPGNYSLTFSRVFPVQVEIFMLGAGGGGQGGSRNGTTNDRIGTGASGGGGAATYVKFTANSSVTFDITVGEGGRGGVAADVPTGSLWQSGTPGSHGQNTTVRVGSVTYTAEGGRRGGGSGQVLTAGVGGLAGSRPANLSDWISKSGEGGVNGIHPGNISGTSRGGTAALIAGTSSMPSVVFGGGLGATHNRAAETGGGGRAGYGNLTGGDGGHGRVAIIITEI